MNTVETAAMLEWVSRHDTFLVVDELTVRAWCDVLHKDIDARWCKTYLVHYFGKADPKKLTAGRINEAWLHYKEREQPVKQIESSEPMPEWFRESMKEIGRL